MAHVRKDTLCKTRNWHKHMRKNEKRVTNRDERRAAKREIYFEASDQVHNKLMEEIHDFDVINQIRNIFS